MRCELLDDREVARGVPISKGRITLASWKDEYARGKVVYIVDLKDGYPISDYMIDGEKRVLEFLMPICYPKKPNRVTMTLRNTIFISLSGECHVD